MSSAPARKKARFYRHGPDTAGNFCAGDPEDGSEQAVRGLLLQSNFPYMDAIWP